jgi:hypothetical protein
MIFTWINSLLPPINVIMSFSWDDLEIQIAKEEKKEQEKLAK